MIRYRTGRDIGYNPRMAQILIRNIDDAVIEALRRRAAARGTSVEEEARRILTRKNGRPWPRCLGPQTRRKFGGTSAA
jgi:hypothetical protein